MIGLAILLFVVGVALLVASGIGYHQTTTATTTPARPATTPQRLMLTDGRMVFAQTLQQSINALPMGAQAKQQLYQFTLQADTRLSQLMQSEGVPVALTGVRFGALTVTFRLRLREFSRSHLANLMKLDTLITQALSVESVRLIPGAGWIDCEVSSPVRVTVDVRTLQATTTGTVVTVGLDTTLQPVTVDISQHGLIAAIAPSRRGKTQAIKSMIYQLKKANPSFNVVVVAFKVADWQAFDGSAALILDSGELKQFQTWLLAQMYSRAKQPARDRWIVVFDDLVNLLATNPELTQTVMQCASLGAGTGITTIASTQFTGKSSGGTDIFANATCRLMFKPSSNLQGARDGGQAGLGLDQLSTAKGDALLVCDGETTRLTTALTPDSLIEQLSGTAPDRAWLAPTNDTVKELTLNPNELLIEKLNGWLLEDGVFDWDTGRFTNRTEAFERLGISRNGRNMPKLEALEAYIFEQYNRDR